VPKRLISLLALGAIALAACGGAGQSTTTAAAGGECGPDHPALHEPGKLTVATGDVVYPPWMLNDDPAGGEGFENSVVYAVAEQLGFDREDVVWVRTTFDEALVVGDKDYDFNIQQFSITPERQEQFDFSVPYYVEEKALVAFPEALPGELAKLGDIEGLKYGAMIGTTDLSYIEDVIGATDVQVFDELADVFLAMEGKQIDATVVGLPTALFATAVQVPDATIAAILPDSEGDDGLGMLFEKGHGFVECVNQALTALDQAGKLDELATEWLASGGEIPRLEK
jgi:polar amino acid transport system substrate-binding protein